MIVDSLEVFGGILDIAMLTTGAVAAISMWAAGPPAPLDSMQNRASKNISVRFGEGFCSLRLFASRLAFRDLRFCWLLRVSLMKRAQNVPQNVHL